jgi:S-adenosylmethionine:tRNA ribosyltransferase-isomerase
VRARTWQLSDFDYALPEELIAQHPAPERSGSRLLDGTGPAPADRVFRDLPALLAPGDLLVFNDTRVLKARLHGRKATGGAVEILVERVLPQAQVLAHVRTSKSLRPGTRVRCADAFEVEVIGRDGPEGALFRLQFPSDPFALLDAHGRVPLPPYITHADEAQDALRYQTVFAQRPGAVAAPTAALHFDEALLAALQQRGVASARVTLHVGAGTFQPVRSENLQEHRMHTEWFEVPASTQQAIARARAAGARVVAVGTTTLRALESAALHLEGGQPGQASTLQTGADGSVHGDTGIFITPGFGFRTADHLLTNFHLPRSTLMMLVTAYAGYARVMALYRHAIEKRYRFYSYGDAMLLRRAPPGTDASPLA